MLGPPIGDPEAAGALAVETPPDAGAGDPLAPEQAAAIRTRMARRGAARRRNGERGSSPATPGAPALGAPACDPGTLSGG